MYRVWFLLFCIAVSLPATGQSYDELNNVVLQLHKEGKYAEALPIALKAKNIAQKEFGNKSYKYALSLSNLASTYEYVGDHTSAEPLFKQAMSITKKIYGEQHPYFATDLNNLAGLYESMGNYTGAEPLFKQALAIRKKVLGEERPDYAVSPKQPGIGIRKHGQLYGGRTLV